MIFLLAVPAEGPWHPAAGGAGSNGAVAAHPVLCGCQLGAGHPDRKGRDTGHHLPGVPVPEAGADGGEQAQKEAEKGKSGKEACQGEKARRAAQKGKADPEHPVHHPARSRDADPGCIRRAAHHPHPGVPWRARGGPCCSGPQLRQAAGMAIPGAGCA